MPLGFYVGNVGQGQCVTCIVGSGATVMAAVVDVGGSGTRLGRWLKQVGVRYIPAIVLTHNHKDHIQGLTAIVEAYAGKIGKVYYVIDQPPKSIPCWLPIQEWLKDKKIKAAAKVCPEDTSESTNSKALLPPDFEGFQLSCVYPTEMELAAVAQGAELLGTSPEANDPNAASAVLRLTRSTAPDRSIALLGGDLTFRGWRRLQERNCDLRTELLVVPHHGSATGTMPGFGPLQLAQAMVPRFAFFSVGTDNSYDHPSPEMVRAFRGVGSVVVCTQITSKCHANPTSVPGKTVLPADPAEPKLTPSGVACAGSIVVRVPDTGPAEVLRISTHQDAVNGLPTTPVCPLCRP